MPVPTVHSSETVLLPGWLIASTITVSVSHAGGAVVPVALVRGKIPVRRIDGALFLVTP